LLLLISTHKCWYNGVVPQPHCQIQIKAQVQASNGLFAFVVPLLYWYLPEQDLLTTMWLHGWGIVTAGLVLEAWWDRKRGRDRAQTMAMVGPREGACSGLGQQKQHGCVGMCIGSHLEGKGKVIGEVRAWRVDVVSGNILAQSSCQEIRKQTGEEVGHTLCVLHFVVIPCPCSIVTQAIADVDAQ
jgi:hypothetical protein